MEICDCGHDEIVFECYSCPVCDLQGEIGDLEDTVDELEGEVEDLEQVIILYENKVSDLEDANEVLRQVGDK